MGRLHDKIIRDYVQHYSRVNRTIDPRGAGAKWLDNMEATYGGLVSSLPTGSRVLDLGCGTGFLLRWLSMHPGIVPVGVDSCPTQVEVAEKSLPDVELVCQDGTEFLRRHQNSFVAIFCTDVLEHIPDQDSCLELVEAAKDSLLPGGFFCCRAPNAASLVGTHSRYLDLTHYRSFTSPSIIQLLAAAGLSDCRIVPIRSGHLTGKVRLLLERIIHKTLFGICGRPMEDHFTSNVCAVGYKKGTAENE